MADNHLPPLRHLVTEAAALPTVALAGFRKADSFEPFGNGRPALVIPGMLGGDRSTALLRRSLDAAGFASSGWGAGINGRVNAARLAAVTSRLCDITDDAGQPALIIGWSLGGFFARILAHRLPERVSLIATLGTPFSGDRHANRAWRLYELLNDHSVDDLPFVFDPSGKPPVKTLAFWSAIDGIVSVQSARGQPHERDKEYEMPEPHMALATSKPAIAQIITVIRDEVETSAKAKHNNL